MVVVCQETKNRIRLAVAAYAYELHDDSIMSDAEFDKLSLEIDPTKDTGRPVLDKFFREVFDPNTGSWIHKHPEILKIQTLYLTFYRPKEERKVMNAWGPVTDMNGLEKLLA